MKKTDTKWILFTLCLILLLTVPAWATQQAPPEELLAKGDMAYKCFNNRTAMALYESALQIDPENYEAAWKLARAYTDIGEKTLDNQVRRDYYNKALGAAQQAVQVYPKGSKGHLYISIALGRIALDSGPKERVKLSKDVKQEVDKALALDPEDDIAWHVLGRWHRKLSTLGWIEKKFANIFLGGVPEEASLEKSVECFKKAIKLNPSHINHHLELGFTYEEMGRNAKALSQYRKVLELPQGDADDEDHKEKAQARIKDME